MVEDFGSYLKHERELRGVPLEEIAGTTKIHIRFLQALEENSFDQLPGEVFIKGYIRSYAETIGSDAEEMLNIYKESVGGKNEENAEKGITADKVQPKTILVYGLSILAFAGILFAIGNMVKNGVGEDFSGKLEEKKAALPQVKMVQELAKDSNIEQQDQPVAQEVEDIVKEAIKADNLVEPKIIEQKTPDDATDAITQEKDEQKSVSVQALVEPPKLATAEDSLPASGSQDPVDVEKSLKLTIKAKEPSWFNMTIDDFREEDFILPAGTAKTFRGNEKIRLTVGNRSGVELFLNGETLILPEGKDKVVKDFIINSKGVE
ncbi:MAG: helix-turn-helix domain-containing protein [Nitrospinaceae bacterium]|nr:helix-turn-helix domain-containing protein [Nitrospinaceae bacterium]